MQNLAPIVLFVYNRLDHTKQTINALKKNYLATDSILYIFSDAPNNKESIVSVKNVRHYIHSIKGFKEIIIVEREKNYGLAKSIINGVSKVVNRYGKVIVLEDDLITSPYFLHYMNDTLNIYHNKKSVMSISAYMYPIEQKLPETFFTYFTSCWGWGTWEDRWKAFERDPESLIKSMSSSDIKKFNLDGADNIWRQVKLNTKGKIYTWAVFWYATVFRKKGLVLHPAVSLTMNIGHDGSGVHCGCDLNYKPILATERIENFERNIINNQIAVDKIKKFLVEHKLSIWKRIINKLKKIWKKI